MYFVRIFLRCEAGDVLALGATVAELERHVEDQVSTTLLEHLSRIYVDRVDISEIEPAGRRDGFRRW